MTISHTWPDGGLRLLHSDSLASDQPAHAGQLGALAHNQALISATLEPRHVVNDLYGQDNGGSDVSLSIDGYGRLLLAWPRLERIDGVELVAKANAAAGADTTLLYLVVSEAPYAGHESWAAVLDSGVACAYVTVEEPTYEWLSFSSIEPSRRSGLYYLSLWGVTDGDPADTSSVTIRALSVRERRRATP